MSEYLLCQRKARPGADRAAVLLHFLQRAGIVGRIDNHRNTAVVLRSGTQHGGAADVDVLDRFFERAARLGHGLRERVQIDYHEVDRLDACLLDGGHVRGQIAPRQQSAVDLRMQRLDAAVEHFGETGVIGHLRDRYTVVGQQLGGSAGGQDAHAESGQASGELDETALVGDADQGLADGLAHGGRE